MSHAAAEKVGALVLFLALAVPSVSQAIPLAALTEDFGAAGGGPNLEDVNDIPETDSTTLNLLFSTSGGEESRIFGWTGTLTTTGTLQIIDYDPTGNSNTASGPGVTSCDPSFLPGSSCSTSGGDAGGGEVGTNIIMFSVTVSGGSPGNQLLYTGDFTLSDWSSESVEGQVLALVVPEPNTLLLLGFGLAGLALAGKSSA